MIKKGSKLTQAHKNKISRALKGKMPKNIEQIAGWNKGKRMSKEFREKIRKANIEGKIGMLGRKHTEKTKQKMRKSNKTKLLWQNLEYRKMMSEKHKWQRGKNNPAYIDGRHPLVMRVRHSSKYEEWIKKVFERDNYTCQKCGERGRRLEAHHIKPFSRIWTENKIRTFEQAMDCEELWNIDNGQTLCVKCHKEISTRR